VKIGTPVLLRTVAAAGLALGITAVGLALPAQASPFAAEANAASCSAFKRVKVLSKREILTTVITGELRNNTSESQMMVIERTVSHTRETSRTYSADWTVFKDALKLSVSRTVTEGTTVSGAQSTRINVAPRTTVIARGNAQSWWVKSEVTQRDSKCKYKTWQVEGEVASSGSLVWTANEKR